jgi:hypothetical protein
MSQPGHGNSICLTDWPTSKLRKLWKPLDSKSKVAPLGSGPT